MSGRKLTSAIFAAPSSRRATGLGAFRSIGIAPQCWTADLIRRHSNPASGAGEQEGFPCAACSSQSALAKPARREKLLAGQPPRVRAGQEDGDGRDVAIIACGFEVGYSLQAQAQLAEGGIQARVLDMHTIKPVDEAAIAKAARECGAIVTAEEHLLDGGLGSQVARSVARTHPVPMEFVGIQNTYAESATPDQLMEKYGLTAPHIVQAVKTVLTRK